MSANPVSEMGFKVPGFRQAPEIIPCPGCGVMTRSNGQPAKRFPNTKCRGPGGYCYKCGKVAATVSRQAPPRPKMKAGDLAVERGRQVMVEMARQRRARELDQLKLVMKRRKTVQPAYSNA